MARRSVQTEPAPAVPSEGAVGPRQPCPCGSGKRYKNCHGGKDAADVFVRRPFEGLPSECDIVAMRELVPAASAELSLSDAAGDAHAERTVRLCTLLPAMSPAMARESGEVWLGLQVQHAFGDPSRDLAAVLQGALDLAAAGESDVVGLLEAPGPGPRLQDLVTGERLEVAVHEGFDFWLDDVPDDGSDPEERAAALEQANAGVQPTQRLASVEAAYWTRMGAREYLRWVMPEPEDDLMTALARLHLRGADSVLEGSRLIGAFRAHGLLVPVWDLPVGTGAAALEEAAAALKTALDEALADESPVTPELRSARTGLANRQVTIR